MSTTKKHFCDLVLGQEFKTEHGTFHKIRDAKGNKGGSARVIKHRCLSFGQVVSIAKNRLCEIETYQ